MSKPDTKPEVELDVDDGHDRAMLRRAIKNRWPVPDELKAKLMGRLNDVLDAGDPRDITSAGRIIVAAEQQNQADDHLDRKEQRLDDGQPTEGLTIRVVRENRLPDGDAA